MPAKRDYYEILEITRESTTEEIKKAYRKQALRLHPDRNPGDEQASERFKKCAEAYEILSDTEKKSRYDRYGHAGLGSGSSGGAGFQDVSDIFEAFGDMFGGVFGGNSGKRRRRGTTG